MREGGLTRLALADGTTLERPPPSPLERAAMAVAKAAGSGPGEEEDDDELAEEERAERDLKDQWSDYWGRMTRASGAACPPFPGVETAASFFRSAPG